MDFKAGLKPNEYAWTGQNIDKTVDAYKLQTGGGFHYKTKKMVMYFKLKKVSYLKRNHGKMPQLQQQKFILK